MAKIYGDVNGIIIRFMVNEADELHYGAPPDYVSMLEFDIITNQEVIDGIKTDWNNHTLVNGVLYHSGLPVIINPPGEEYLALQAVETEYPILPDWARTGTAAQAETFINTQIWNGQTQAQVEAWIDANITNITTANVSQINLRLAAIRQGLKLAAGAIITMRGLFILTAKLLIYIRDLVIRFRSSL